MTTTRVLSATNASVGSGGGLLGEPRDRDNPSILQAVACDPVSAIEPEIRKLMARDLGGGTRRYVFPVVRVIANLVILTVISLKRAIPVRLYSHRLLSVWTAWFARRFAGPAAQIVMLRHFIIESQLLNFVARNAARGRVPEVDLLPTRIEELGDFHGANAVALHDANLLNLLIDLGETADVDVETRRPLAELDFSMLEMPELSIHRHGQWINFDLSTVIYMSAVMIALFFDDRSIERAVNSFQLDEPLLCAIANMTGEDSLRTLAPIKFTHWLGSTGDVPRDLHWHILVHEQTYGKLLRLKAKAELSRGL